jgi:hypothetical protein
VTFLHKLLELRGGSDAEQNLPEHGRVYAAVYMYWVVVVGLFHFISFHFNYWPIVLFMASPSIS